MQLNVHCKGKFTASWSKSERYKLSELEQDNKILNILQFTVKYISILRYFSLHKALPNCPLTVSKVHPLSALSVLGKPASKLSNYGERSEPRENTTQDKALRSTRTQYIGIK